MALCSFMKQAIFYTICLVLFSPGPTHCQSTKGLVVTTSRVWVAGTQEKVCFVSKSLDSEVVCAVKLVNPHNESQSLHESHNIRVPSSGSICANVSVPVNITGSVAKLIVWTMSPSSYKFSKSSDVSIQRAGHMTFIQTDKPMYKPSDLVRVRILTLKGQDLKILTDDISLAYVEDPTRTRVRQWTNLSTINGLGSLEMQLSDEPRLGEWTLKAVVLGETHSQKFTVAEYVLPKYEVVIHHPSYVIRNAKNMTWKACARYTYGQPVFGTVNSSACTNSGFSPSRCLQMNATKLLDGCAEFVMNPSELWQPHDYWHFSAVDIFAKVEERGTGVKLNSTFSVKMHSSLYNMKFLPEDSSYSNYKPGLPHHGKGLVTYPDGAPVKRMEVELLIEGKIETKVVGERKKLNLLTDDHGRVSYTLPGSFTGQNITSISQKMILQITDSENKPSYYKELKSWYSPSNSFLQIVPFDSVADCKSVLSLPFLFITKLNPAPTLTFFFQMITRGDIVHNGELILQPDSQEGDGNMLYKSNVSFTVTHLMSGSVKVLLFTILPNGETVADSLMVTVKNCFENEVSMEFADQQRQPGHSTVLRLAADPHSLCSISVVDKSMKLLAKGDDVISKSKVNGILKKYDVTRNSYRRYYGRHHLNEDCATVNEEISDVPYLPFHRHKRMVIDPFSVSSEYVDSKEAFLDAGMIVMSDLTIVTRPCRRRLPVYYSASVNGGGPLRKGMTLDSVPAPMAFPMAVGLQRESEGRRGIAASNPMHEEIPVLHRTFFPESWLWQLKSVGNTGIENIQLNLPHTITEWIGNGFCTNMESGLGITSQFSINAFQPFFMSFTLPYSMVRGERVGIPVSVFNYLSQCLKVTLTVQKSSAFELANDSPVGELTVCGQQTEIHTYYIVPRQLGTVNFTIKASSVAADNVDTNTIDEPEVMTAEDIVTQKLLVEAEGKEEEKTQSAYVCAPAEGSWTLDLPDGIVEDSVRASTSIIGDVMGPTLNGLESLLALPTGCGEQNMLKFSPNIFIMQYLQRTNSLTETIKSKALGFLQTGYQRELTYRHKDGSYSAFGNYDKEGSTWLTAFVIKSFAQARPFIYIDQKDLDESINWIISIQLENGCFRQVGQVLHADMKGGLQGNNDNLAGLTAYILVALMEAGVSPQDPVIVRAVQCLNIQTVDDAYTLSLMAYAFTMWDRNETKRTEIMNRLEAKATVADGMKHWSANSPATATEMTSYALLAILHGNQNEAIAEANPIVRWLSTQRNSGGGFTSTQDTVLALQALAQFAALVYGDDFDAQVSISGNGWDHSVNVTKENRMLLQRIEGQALPSKLQYSAKGTGCALIQASLKYNILSIQNDPQPSFLLRVRVQRPKNNNCKERILNICTRYNGPDNKTNMAIIAVKMVSGWIPDKDSIKRLQNNAKLQLKRYEVDKNTVQLYFDELDKIEKCLPFSVHQSIIVTKTKPALVHVYDYYRPSLSAYSDYSITSTCGTKEEIRRPDGNEALNKRNDTITQQRLLPKIGQLTDGSKPSGNKSRTNKKSTEVRCPVCNSENATTIRRKLCSAQHGYIADVVNRTTLNVQRELKPDANILLNNVTVKYHLGRKCSCSALKRGSRMILLLSKEISTTSKQAIRLRLDSKVTVTEANRAVIDAIEAGLTGACQ